MVDNVRRRKDFNTTDMRSVLDQGQLDRLQQEIADLFEPEEKEMPKIKDELRQQIVNDVKQQKAKVSDDDLQGLLKANAKEDIEIV